MKYSITILAGILLIQLVLVTHADSNKNKRLPWYHHSIALVEATNEPIHIATPEPPASYQTLQQLKATQEPENATNSSAVPCRDLAELSLAAEVPHSNYIARLNNRRVTDAIKKNNALFRLGDQDTACKNLEELLESVEDAELRYRINSMLGILHFKRRTYEESASYFAAAYTNRPADAQLACNLAAAYMSYGALQEANILLQNVDLNLILNQQLISAINFNLACINSLMLNKSDALEYLSRAADADPTFTATYIGDLQLDNIRNENRFESIRRKLNLMLQDNQSFNTDARSAETSVQESTSGLKSPNSNPQGSMKMSLDSTKPDTQ